MNLSPAIQYVVEDASTSTSDAQFEQKAFRYLSESNVLILPLYCASKELGTELFVDLLHTTRMMWTKPATSRNKSIFLT
jgi:hypothetical protein